MIPLEDSFGDMIGKAQRGALLTDPQVVTASGITSAQLGALKDGQFDEAALLAVAPVLNLHADRLLAIAKGEWRPREQPSLDGLACFNTTFEDMTVNAYLVWDPASKEAVVFDTGADATPILQTIANQGLKVKFILLTHTHGDHIADLDRLKTETGAPAFMGQGETANARPFDAGETFTVGALKIETRPTHGHAVGGITFVVTGLEKPLAIVGDAIFAGSMGGGAVSFRDAVRTNKASIYSLSDETVICPGHGPLTTVGEEKAHNPFAPV